MNDLLQNTYTAVKDFHEARRKADLQVLISQLTGKSAELLSYEEVRQKLRAMEGSSSSLKDIPLDAIVGSVGRYTDFTRTFFPREDFDKDRWASVMKEAIGQTGLPPIDVYRVGEAYFVLDGNHRVSVARQLGAEYIQANVTEVRTRVPLTADIQPDDLILKAEYTQFLVQTQLDKLRPESDLTLTLPGQYPIIEEHISVHRYLMGIDEGREIPYEEAVSHWYDTVYEPIAEIICERGILYHFPGRTEADLYLWLSKHRSELQEELGWSINAVDAANDLAARFSEDFGQTVSRVAARILDIVTPDGLEAGPPPGTWRKSQENQHPNCLFGSILVGISKDDTLFKTLDQAILIAQKEQAMLHGLHVVKNAKQLDSKEVKKLEQAFIQRCDEHGVAGDFAVEVGTAARQICDRAHWTDLIIGPLTHPPADTPLERLSSGFRVMVRRCSRPILAIPEAISQLNHALLAYNGSPKAKEALYISAYMMDKWQIPLTVLIIESSDLNAESLMAEAQEYLANYGPPRDFLLKDGPVTETILIAADEIKADLILIGGYKASPMVEIVKGSFVDEMLRATQIPTLICR